MKSIANKKFLFLLSVVLAFGMAAAGCGDGYGKPDPLLNGEWKTGGINYNAFKFNNGNFEIYEYYNDIIYYSYKGTYTTNANELTMNVTHVHGGNDERFQSKWYSKAELISSGFFTQDEIDDIDELFPSSTFTYSVSGNALTLTSINDSITLTKK